MIQERNIVLCVVLSLVTCGIYGIYWMICLANDLNTAADTTNDTSGAMVFVFSLITCGIYTYYWMYKAGEKIQKAQASRNLPADSNSGVLYLVLTLFGLGIVSYCLIQNELNKMATDKSI